MIKKNILMSILLFALHSACAIAPLSHTHITYNDCNPETVRSSAQLSAIIISLTEQIDPHAYHSNNPSVNLSSQGYTLLQTLISGGYIALNTFNNTNTVCLNVSLPLQKLPKKILKDIQQKLGAASHQTQ
jgi:hypothetical protein